MVIALTHYKHCGKSATQVLRNLRLATPLTQAKHVGTHCGSDPFGVKSAKFAHPWANHGTNCTSKNWELDAGEHVRDIVQPLKTCEEVLEEHFEEVKR